MAVVAWRFYEFAFSLTCWTCRNLDVHGKSGFSHVLDFACATTSWDKFWLMYQGLLLSRRRLHIARFLEFRFLFRCLWLLLQELFPSCRRGLVLGCVPQNLPNPPPPPPKKLRKISPNPMSRKTESKSAPRKMSSLV